MKKIYFWKRKSTRIVLAISIALMFFCVIQILRPNREYFYEGDILFQEGIPVEDFPVYEGIQLPPGVYRVELMYSSSTDMQNLCYVQDRTVYPQGLLTHGDQFYSGLSATSFHMWLFENADALRILIKYCGQGSLRTGDLHIYETNQLWGMYLTVILFFTALILGLLFLRAYDRTYPISGENKNVMFALSVLALVASVPYLSGTTLLSGADLTYHLHRIEGIRNGILAGQFPVRLESQWVHGYGYANGIFYCGTLLLFPALLRVIGFPVAFSYNCYGIALNIATVLIAYYSFSRIFRDKYIGVVGSALYTLSVFRIFKLLYATAVGRQAQSPLCPWCSMASGVYSRRMRAAGVTVPAGAAGHRICGVDPDPCSQLRDHSVFNGYSVFCIYQKNISESYFLGTVQGGNGGAVFKPVVFGTVYRLLSAGGSAYQTCVGKDDPGKGLYLPQLMFNWWRFGDNSAGVGFILMLGFLVYGVLWFSGRLEDLERPLRKLGKTAWMLGGLLMLMSLQVFPWDKIQNTSRLAASLVSSLQFPNRFLGWGCVFLVLLCCGCLSYFKKRQQKAFYFIGLLCVLAGITTSGMYLYDHMGRDHYQLALYNPEGMGAGYISGAEYLVQGTEEEMLLYRAPVVSEGILVSEYEKGALRAEFICDNTSGQEGYVDLPLLHYYGYRAYADDGNEQLQVCKGDNNVVRVIIPPDCNTQITVKFVSPWYWRVAEIVSYLSAAWICIVRKAWK